MVTSPVMKVDVSSSIPARSVPRILTGKLQGQLPIHVTPKANYSQYFEHNQTKKETTKLTPPTTIDQIAIVES